MRYFELCEKSVNFAEEIMESPEFKELVNLKEEISLKIPNLVLEFNKAKEKYEKMLQQDSLNYKFIDEYEPINYCEAFLKEKNEKEVQ